MKVLGPVLVGLGLAIATIVVAQLLPTDRTLMLLAVILGASASVYAGAALAEQHADNIRLETTVFVILSVAAVLGLWFSPWFLVGGYVAHGVWDFFHHPHRIGAKAGPWFPPFCGAYDLIVGLFIVVALR